MQARNIFLVTIVFGFFLFIYINLLMGENCYIPLELQLLEKISDTDVEKNSIFFLETSFEAFEHGVIQVKKRVACALESAALHHPNRSVYMIFIFPSSTRDMQIYDKFLKPIFTYPNVRIVYAVTEEYVKGSPVENLYKKRLIDKSPFWVTHNSDVMRVLTLAKYGGIYLDMDVIVRKSLDDLGENFIALENDRMLASGVAGFGRDEWEFLNDMLRDLNESYQPDKWAENGPLLFTRWVQKLCNTSNLSEFSNKKCKFLRILSPNHFYPIYYPNWNKLFNSQYNEEVLRSVKDSYLVHYWNKLSSGTVLRLDSNASYLILAKKNCPKVYSQLYKTL